jgi:hypothetical protein
LYCLGSLLRHNPPGQEQFLAHGGLEALQALARQLMAELPAGEAPAAARAAATTSNGYAAVIDAKVGGGGGGGATAGCAALDQERQQLLAKVVTLVVDLVDNAAEESRPTHPAMVRLSCGCLCLVLWSTRQLGPCHQWLMRPQLASTRSPP